MGMPIGNRSVAGLVLQTAVWIATTLAACAGSSERSQPEPDATRPGITVIRSKQFWFDWDRGIESADEELERGIADAIQRRLPHLRYIPRERFCREMFPNLPDTAAPVELESIKALLESSEFRRRLDALHLRYIVYVSGRTEIEAHHFWLAIGGTGPAGTVAGWSVWKKESVLAALVFDREHPSQTQRAEHTAGGTAWVGGMFPFIVGVPADPEVRTGRQLGEQLVAILADAHEREVRQREAKP